MGPNPDTLVSGFGAHFPRLATKPDTGVSPASPTLVSVNPEETPR